MSGRIRLLLVFEAITYVIAALVHGGVVLRGYEHSQARLAESIIAAVLAVGIATSVIRPAITRGAALWSQGFALVATLVGIAMITLGVGPRTVPDVLYHVAIIGVLIYGLHAARSMRTATRAHGQG